MPPNNLNTITPNFSTLGRGPIVDAIIRFFGASPEAVKRFLASAGFVSFINLLWALAVIMFGLIKYIEYITGQLGKAEAARYKASILGAATSSLAKKKELAWLDV